MHRCLAAETEKGVRLLFPILLLPFLLSLSARSARKSVQEQHFEMNLLFSLSQERLLHISHR